jgi:hypothetical protein
MSSYRFLADHYIGTAYFLAGTTASTRDVGGTLPINWGPSGNCEPLDAPAVNAFYAAGVQPPGLIRQQWSNVPVSVPVTYWRQIPGGRLWHLTGLGAALAPIGV